MPNIPRTIMTGLTITSVGAALSACTVPAESESAAAGDGRVPVAHASSLPGLAGETTTSDVTQLEELGVHVGDSVLIDAPDDGVDRYLEVAEDGSVDFTGVGRTDTTMMAFKPAELPPEEAETDNRVVIAPPFWNEGLGAGSCVADVAPGQLQLATCAPGAVEQIWHVLPVGESGQFELHGASTQVHVDNGELVTDGGHPGLSTVESTTRP